MKTKTVSVAHQRMPAPLVDHPLLAKTNTPTKPADPWNLGLESFTVRATTVSVVLKEILDQEAIPTAASMSEWLGEVEGC